MTERQDSQVSYMWEEYTLTFGSAQEYRDPSKTNIPDLKKAITALKSEIRGLGSVNVNAIEDYKELLERHTFLTTQHEDLLKAEEALIRIIAELDEGMRIQFREQFAKIQTEFDKAFKELFGGGHGTLELVEGEDILEAGVRITAQPPGKKLQKYDAALAEGKIPDSDRASLCHPEPETISVSLSARCRSRRHLTGEQRRPLCTVSSQTDGEYTVLSSMHAQKRHDDGS